MKCLYDVENVNVGLMIEVFRALNFVQHQKQQYIWFFHDIAKLREVRSLQVCWDIVVLTLKRLRMYMIKNGQINSYNDVDVVYIFEWQSFPQLQLYLLTNT